MWLENRFNGAVVELLTLSSALDPSGSLTLLMQKTYASLSKKFTLWILVDKIFMLCNVN